MKNKYIPDWMKDSYQKARLYLHDLGEKIEQATAQDQTHKNGQEEPENDDKPPIPPETVAVAAAASTVTSSDEKNTKSDQELMLLTKKLIEIRNLLKSIDQSASAIQLPSIVVIGSQSSGKSSVLEAIVGHEFLPKGSNMVTRRPIELTLIHTPDSTTEYGEFPQLGLGKMSDFTKIQKTLVDLNLAVPESECVSSTPIELKIFSPNVPDLSLIDLPGYIQIHTKNQPIILREKIQELCEKYIQEPNIILAVCAADVDLANSEALRASRRADPFGIRTIGVLTKMDLVEPQYGVNLITKNDYPLQLGYVGVVCKGSAHNASALIQSEAKFFKSHSEYLSSNSNVGTPTLRRRLVTVLEQHMGRQLYSISDKIQEELEDARYQFKVHYNDRRISPESYVAETMDGLKTRFKEFTKEFGKQQVLESFKTLFEKRVLDIMRDVFWNDASIDLNTFMKTCNDEKNGRSVADTKIDIASSVLTKSGVGRMTTQHVVNVLMATIEKLTNTDEFKHHAVTRKKILDYSHQIIRDKFPITVDQVENTIKPFKVEVDVSDQEWKDSIKNACVMIENELANAHQELKNITLLIGRRKLRRAISSIAKMGKEAESIVSSDEIHLEDTVPADVVENIAHKRIIEKGKEAIELQRKITLLQSRLSATKSRQCSNRTNKQCCPEVHLSAISQKLISTSVMFIWIELLNEFYFTFPRELENKLYYALDKQAIVEFANENEDVKRHLEVQRRCEVLEDVMEKMKDLTRRHE